MPPSAKPRKPVANWEQVRDEWVTAVDRFMTEVEGWARKQEWATLRDPKTIDEDRIGAYTVPRLLIHAIFGRFLFDPVCRFVVGAAGLIDLSVMPSFDSVMIARSEEGQWFLHDERKGRVKRKPWNEEMFVKTIEHLRRQECRVP
jgi:hypothetical protein